MTRNGTSKMRARLQGLREMTTTNYLQLVKGRFVEESYEWNSWDDTFNLAASTTLEGKKRSVAHTLFDWAYDLPGLRRQGRAAIVLFGPKGMGKTHISRLAGIYATIAHDLRDPVFCNWSTFLARGRADKGSVDLRPLMDAGFLVLDDVSKERTTLWALEQLYPVINSRWGRPTIVTMNVPVSQWEAKILANGSDRRGEDRGSITDMVEAIADRLACGKGGLCNGHVLVQAHNGKSYRRI